MDLNLETMAFSKWRKKNKISTSAITLWYSLMEINCSVGWKRKFNAPISMLQESTGLSKQGLINARNSLVENDLIIYEKGKKGCAGYYQFVSLVKPVDLLQLPGFSNIYGKINKGELRIVLMEQFSEIPY